MPIGGYDPRRAGGPPGGLPVTGSGRAEIEKIKKRERKILSRIDKVGTVVQIACVAYGAPLALGSGPEIFTKLGLAGCGLLVGVLKGGAALGDLWFDYVDPFDPNYREIADPGTPLGVHITSPPASPRVARAVNPLSDNFFESRDVLLALLTAINRAQSARQAGDQEARAAQLGAAKRFAGRSASLLAERQVLRRRVADALKGAVLGPDRVRALGRKTARDGLPDDLVAILQAFGAPRAWIEEEFEDDVARIRGRIDIRQVLLDDDLDHFDERMARSFRIVQRGLR